MSSKSLRGGILEGLFLVLIEEPREGGMGGGGGGGAQTLEKPGTEGSKLLISQRVHLVSHLLFLAERRDLTLNFACIAAYRETRVSNGE